MDTTEQFAYMVLEIGKFKIRHVADPAAVRGRNFANRLVREKLGSEPLMTLREGLARTCPWMAKRPKQLSTAGIR